MGGEGAIGLPSIIFKLVGTLRSIFDVRLNSFTGFKTGTFRGEGIVGHKTWISGVCAATLIGGSKKPGTVHRSS